VYYCAVSDIVLLTEQIQGMHQVLATLPQEKWSTTTLYSDLISKTGRYYFSKELPFCFKIIINYHNKILHTQHTFDFII
jgi:hypothetical protein